MVQALRAVRGFRPDVVFSTGGYVSVPPTWAAGLLRVPVLVHEQTVQVGLATRLNARWATKIALSFEGAADELPPDLRKKTVVTGNPVRQVIFNGERTRAVERFGFAGEDNGLPCVYVTGGAQGSRIVNRAVEACLRDLLERARVIHQCGQQPTGTEQDFDRLSTAKNALPPELARRFFVTRFVGDEIGDVFALADLLVARSGAGTVTEACALGKLAVFVPLVPTRGDEQTRNAQRSVDAGAAVILPQPECDGPRLLAVLKPLLDDPDKRSAMGRTALTLARPNAARDLADALLALARA
jgi:UDP-N-acetylglucosamine--N-acetylmuramyl-(pentapeptide) pyrophosphoryl-undecaprenol N-acetylglucosamine transferase